MNEISEKQLEANRQNAQLGGIKTAYGKMTSRYNALKHGIHKNVLSEYEEGIRQEFIDDLLREEQPADLKEEILVERIATHYIHLFRIRKAEREYMETINNPTEWKYSGPKAAMEMGLISIMGYQPVMGADSIERILNTFARYETAIENRLYKAMHELERLQRIRKGEHVEAPKTIDVITTEDLTTTND